MLCDIEPGPIEDLNYRGQHRRGIERFVDAVLNDRPALVEPQQARAVSQSSVLAALGVVAAAVSGAHIWHAKALLDWGGWRGGGCADGRRTCWPAA